MPWRMQSGSQFSHPNVLAHADPRIAHAHDVLSPLSIPQLRKTLQTRPPPTNHSHNHSAFLQGVKPEVVF